MFQKPGQEGASAPPSPTRQPAEPPAASATTMPATAVAAPPARISGEAASVIGPALAIRGGSEGRGTIHLQGRAWGDVKVENLMVGEAAALEGSVIAAIVEVRGRVTGSIDALNVRLLPSAQVDGDITYETLHIEPGASFEGRCIKTKPVAAAASPVTAQASARSVEPPSAKVEADDKKGAA